MSTGWLARASVLLLSQWCCFRKFVWNAKKLMCSVRFSRKPNIHDKREKKQNFMTKPSQYPEKYTRPMRYIHHSTIMWLDPVIPHICSNIFIYVECLIYQNPRNDRKMNTFKFLFLLRICSLQLQRWSGGATVLGTGSAGASYSLDDSRAMAYCASSMCGWGLFAHFYFQLSFLSSFSLSLGDGPI